MRSRIGVGIGGAVAVALVLALHAAPAHSTGVEVVSPEHFDIAVPAGKSLTTEIVISRTARSLVPQTLSVSPALAPFVSSIEPNTLPPTPPSFAPGSTMLVTVTFTVAPQTAAVDVEGELLVGAKPLLPMALSIGDLSYPPDPGEAGKETLEGIDSDANGVRDDIQRYIEMTYPEEPDVRAALRQYAVPLQAALVEAGDKEESIAHAHATDRSTQCLWFFTDIDTAHRSHAQLRALMLNTDERSREYIRYNRQLGGQVFPGTSPEDRAATCDSQLLQSGGSQ